MNGPYPKHDSAVNVCNSNYLTIKCRGTKTVVIN